VSDIIDMFSISVSPMRSWYRHTNLNASTKKQKMVKNQFVRLIKTIHSQAGYLKLKQLCITTVVLIWIILLIIHMSIKQRNVHFRNQFLTDKTLCIKQYLKIEERKATKVVFIEMYQKNRFRWVSDQWLDTRSRQPWHLTGVLILHCAFGNLLWRLHFAVLAMIY
jgi:hypothetical protein